MFNRLIFAFTLFFTTSLFANDVFKNIEKNIFKNQISISEEFSDEEALNYIYNLDVEINKKIDALFYLKEHYFNDKNIKEYDSSVEFLYKLLEEAQSKKSVQADIIIQKIKFYLENDLDIDISKEFEKIYSGLITKLDKQKYQYEEVVLLIEQEKFYKALNILNRLEDKFPTNKENIEVYIQKYKIYKNTLEDKNKNIYMDKIIKIYENEKIPFTKDYVCVLDNKKHFDSNFNVNPKIEKVIQTGTDLEAVNKAKLVKIKYQHKLSSINEIEEIKNFYEGKNRSKNVEEALLVKSYVYLKNEKYEEAINTLNNIDAKYYKLNKIKMYKTIQKAMGNDKKALEYAIQYENEMNEKYNKNFEKSIAEITMMFEILEKEKETVLLERKAAKQEEAVLKEKNETILINKIIIISYFVLSVVVLFAIISVIAYRKIVKIRTIDDLTKIYNERAILGIAKRAMARKKGYFSLIMLNVEGLEKIEDQEEYNEVLKIISNEAKNTLRKEDSIGRYKEESFLIISNNNKKISHKIAERMIENIQENTSANLYITPRIVQKKKYEKDLNKLLNILNK